MTVSRVLLSLLLLAPLTAQSAIIDDGGGGDGGGGGGGSGGGGGTTTPVWSKSYSKSALFGSSSWGAGYKLDGRVSATPATSTTRDKLDATMGLETYAKLNGGYHRVISVRATGATEAQRRTDLSLNAYAGSANVYSKSWGSATSTLTFLDATPLSLSTTFFSKSVTVDLFVPVTFSAKATGKIGTTITGKISNVGIEASATPSGQAGLYVSAGIGGQYCVGGACVGASVGVYSDVNLVKASAPAKVMAWWQLAKPTGVLVAYTAKADLTMSSLDGSLGVYAEACLIGCIKESLELISWNGFSASYSVANLSGSYCLAGDCSMSTPTLPLGQ